MSNYHFLVLPGIDVNSANDVLDFNGQSWIRMKHATPLKCIIARNCTPWIAGLFVLSNSKFAEVEELEHMSLKIFDHKNIFNQTALGLAPNPKIRDLLLEYKQKKQGVAL